MTAIGVLPITRIEARVGRSLVATRKPKQAAEAIERVVANAESYLSLRFQPLRRAAWNPSAPIRALKRLSR